MSDQADQQPLMAEEAVPAEPVLQPTVGVTEQPVELGREPLRPTVGVTEQPVELGREPLQPLDLTARQAPDEAVPRQLQETAPLQARLGPTSAQAPVGGTTALAAESGTPRTLQRLEPTAATRRQPSSDGGGGGGSAGSGFTVDPALYQAAVSPILAAADQISQLVTNLTGFLSSMEANAPWGNDESGKKFAEGDKGYIKYSGDTQKALKGLPDGLHFIADGLKAMAQGYQGAEESAISNLDQQDEQLQQASAMPRSPQIALSPTQATTPRAALGDIARGTNR